MRTFSESWHRVSGLEVSLRPSVDVRKQRFRGEDWYVLHDRFNNRFFRVRPAAYAFVARLTPSRTVEEVWHECLEVIPDTAPGQEEVVTLLSQLHVNELLYFTNVPDSERIFSRGQKRRRRELRAQLMNILFFRMRLFDPQDLLTRLLPVLERVFSPLGLLVWLVVVALGLKAVVDNWDALLHPAAGVLAPGNLPWLYLALLLVKTVHEAGHAMLCRHLGGEVHTVGLMIMVFIPLPYVDASSSWQLRDRKARALVGAGGMIGEAFVAGLAAMIWAATGAGTIHALAFNVMIAASVSTLVFNINPLLRFDGYYILSDLLDIPNLYQRSRQQIVHLAERWGFGDLTSASPSENRSEALWLTGYGLASQAYRMLVLLGIVLVVADEFLVLGIIIALGWMVTLVLVPLVRFLSFLVNSPKLAGRRLRALTVGLGGLGGVVMAVAALPLPYGVQASGVVESRHHAQVFSGAPGFIADVKVSSGRQVSEGDELVVLTDRELAFDIAIVEAQLAQAAAAIDRARNDAIADMEPMARRQEALRRKLDALRQRQAALTVTASQPGVWVAPALASHRGTWVERGVVLGFLVSPDAYRFSAVLTQEEAADLFDGTSASGVVRLRGQADTDVPVGNLHIIPFEQHRLPSAVLGWQGGGHIATAHNDPEGRTSREPFFQIFADLPSIAPVTMLHGRSGVLRLDLPWQPLAWQLWHTASQVMQKRYRL